MTMILATRKQLAKIGAAVGGTIVLIGAGVAVMTAGVMTDQATSVSLPQATTTVTQTLPGATITKTLPQATKTITRTLPRATITVKVPSATITCGHAEDDCYPDYIGKGRWVMRHGERPMPKATNKVPGATIAPVCRNSRITRDMIADCNKLASRPAQVTAGFSNPKGAILVQECIASYTNALELRECLRP